MGDPNLGEGDSPPDLCTAMNNFSFGEQPMKRVKLSTESFNGNEFYEKYEDSDFLKQKRNVITILSQQEEFLNVLGTINPGERIEIDEMFIERGIPLLIKKSGCIDESDVNSDEFTYRRLTGLAAAYVWNNINTFEAIYAKEPEALGLHWTKTDWHRRLYLSAISGAELFESAFEYIPFICALKKYSLAFVDENSLLHIASLPHSITGEPMAVWYRREFEKSVHYSQRLFKPEYSHNLNSVVIKAAPFSVEKYLRNLGSY